VNVPDLLDELRATFAPDAPQRYDDLFTRVREAPVLILDDFGAHQTTPWAQEKLYQILNYRYRAACRR
jgi:DNA replication protein DnaC